MDTFEGDGGAMAQTFWDLAQHDRETTWRLIRQLRSRSGDLRRSDAAAFAAALEQSEQLLVAAQSVGTATRAIPLYYGLTQARRAIALTIQPGAWFGSHGVKTSEGSLRGSKNVSLNKLTIRGTGQLTSGFGGDGVGTGHRPVRSDHLRGDGRGDRTGSGAAA